MERFTRRGFLKGALLASGAVAGTQLLAACGSTATPTPAPAKPAEAPKAEAKPTEAPKPAAATAAPAAKPTVAAKPAAAKEVVTLRFHMRAGTEKSEPSMYVKRPAEWSQETGYQMKLEPIPSGQDYIPKLKALIAGNTAGDLAFCTNSRCEYRDMAKSKALESVEPFLQKYGVSKSEWFPVIIEDMTIDGKMQGMPKGGIPENGFLFVNLTMFDKAGLKRPPVEGTKHEDVVNWANALAKGPKDRREVFGYWSNARYFGGFTGGVYRFGGEILDKEGKKCLADTEPFYQWVEWHNKMVNEHKVVPMADAVPSGGITSLFASEKIAMFVGQRSDLKPLKTAIKDKFEWMAIQDAKLPGVGRGAALAVSTHAGLANSKHKEEAFTLLKAISDKRYAYLVAEENGYLAGRVNNLEEIGDYAKDPFIQLQQKVSAEAAKMWVPANLRAFEVENAIVNHLDLLWLGKAQMGKPFMNDLKKVVEEVLAKP